MHSAPKTIDVIRAEVSVAGFSHVEGRLSEVDFVGICEAFGRIVDRCDVRTILGSRSYLSQPGAIPYHTDSPSANFIAWLCASQQINGGEMVVKDGVAALHKLDAAELDMLRRLKVAYPEVPGLHPAGTTTVITEEHGRTVISYAPWLIDRQASRSKFLVRALALLDAFPGLHSSTVEIKVGNILIVDNKRMLHARRALSVDSPRLLHRAWIQANA